ncbi:MAG: ABC transporter permease [Bifidobacterium crudilactis]|jgi:peptide/nickel transport system permease protein|uniref:ABC transporter permease n=1 Tax=Bifidobacterium crudilactis TaxID=327277 RepID=UPI003F9B5CF7
MTATATTSRFDAHHASDGGNAQEGNMGVRGALLTSWLFRIGVGVCLLIVLLCLIAPLITRFSPNQIDLHAIERGPSSTHILGTDPLGRDVFSRLLYGGRMSLLVGISASALQMVIGVIIGLTAGLFGGKVDMVLMRITEIFQCFPFYAIAIAVAAMVGANVWNVVLIIGFLQWTSLSRLVRAEALSLRESEFVQFSRVAGVPLHHILFKDLLLNCVPVVMVNMNLAVTTAILSEAALSFLGLGVTQPDPSWGNMLSAAQSVRVLSSEPWLWLPPGMAIVLLVLSVNAMGEAVSQALRPRLAYCADVNPRRFARIQKRRLTDVQPSALAKGADCIREGAE